MPTGQVAGLLDKLHWTIANLLDEDRSTGQVAGYWMGPIGSTGHQGYWQAFWGLLTHRLTGDDPQAFEQAIRFSG